MPEKRRTSRFFRIKKEEPEEEAAEEVEEGKEAPGEEEAEKIEEAEEELAKETPREGKAAAPETEEHEEPERLGLRAPTPKGVDASRLVKEEIYRLRGVLKTLEDKLDRKEISSEEYAERSGRLNLMLANLYEKKIKRELGI